MHYAYRYHLHPTESQREMLDHHRDTCRQLYNHALSEFEQIPESAGTLNQRVRQVRTNSPTSKSGGTISTTCTPQSPKLQ